MAWSRLLVLVVSPFTTGNPFLGTLLLGFSIDREGFGGSRGVKCVSKFSLPSWGWFYITITIYFMFHLKYSGGFWYTSGV